MDIKIESHGNGKKILIAEDDEAILEVIKAILEGEGFAVFSPTNVKAIFEVARNERPQVMLLDIWLRGHDGGKIAKELKTYEETKLIPIIMMSANNETEKIAKEVGAEGFLLKPFTIDELFQIVRKYTS